MNVQPKQKHNSDKLPIAPTSSQPCSNTNVVRRIVCVMLGHPKIKNKCQRCGEQFGVPKMDCPPEPP